MKRWKLLNTHTHTYILPLTCVCFLLWRRQSNVMRVIFLNYFLIPFSTSKFGMKTSKHRAVNSSFYTISYDMNGLGKTKTSPGHIQLVYTISSDVIGLDKTKTKWRGSERIGTLSCLLFVAKRKTTKLTRNFKKENIHLIISPNYFCITLSQI